MRKIILITSVLMLTGIFTFAQSFHLGIKAGADMHKVDGATFKQQFNLGYHLGAFAEIGLPGKLGIQPEVYFSQVNTKTESSFSAVYGFNNITEVKLSYLNIPLLLSIKPVPVLSLQVGPQFGILLNHDKNIVQNGKDAFKGGDVGVAIGAQLNITKLRIYARYVAGLNDVNNFNTDKWRNQSIHFGLGLRLF